jgi:RNA polymerase sigma-70 factor (ECF subfamily)
MTIEKPAKQQETACLEANALLIKLYEQFRQPIYSYAYRLLGSLEDADDITQEVFIRAFTSWNDLYERENLSAWLYRIATNLCIDKLRRRKRISWWPLPIRFQQREDANSDDVNNYDILSFVSDNGGIPEIAERELIRQSLACVPEEYAAVLVLSAAQGLSYREIAAIIGSSPNAAATRISRAKKMFAQHYFHLSKDRVGDQE